MKSIPLIIWGVGLTAYLVFIAWYHNWGGALKPHEIEAYLQAMDAADHIDADGKKLLEKFMREDKGREFLMLNLIKFPRGQVSHPVSGEKMSAPQLLQDYTQPFLGQIFRRGGHPAYLGRVVAGAVEAWEAENMDWQVVGLIRYRSRRDLVEAVLNPAFADSHIFKQAALAATLAWPVETDTSFMLGPRRWLALLIIALCALAHLIWRTRIA